MTRRPLLGPDGLFSDERSVGALAAFAATLTADVPSFGMSGRHSRTRAPYSDVAFGVPGATLLHLVGWLGRAGVVCVLGCGPVVGVDPIVDAADDTTTVSPAVTSSGDTTNGPQPTCTVGTSQECGCPGLGVGTQTCLPNGDFGACSCPAATGTGDTTTTGSSGGTGQSSDAGESSTGAPQPTECPDIPVPCSGTIAVPSNSGLVDVSMCTSLDGSLTLSGTVSNISSLGCLTEMGDLRIESTGLTDLSGLSRLEQLGTLQVEAASALTHIGLPQLEALGRLTLTGNAALEQLDFAELSAISWTVEVVDNPNLSNCEVEALLDQVGGAGGNVCYASNARDACIPFCP